MSQSGQGEILVDALASVWRGVGFGVRAADPGFYSDPALVQLFDLFRFLSPPAANEPVAARPTTRFWCLPRLVRPAWSRPPELRSELRRVRESCFQAIAMPALADPTALVLSSLEHAGIPLSGTELRLTSDLKRDYEPHLVALEERVALNGIEVAVIRWWRASGGRDEATEVQLHLGRLSTLCSLCVPAESAESRVVEAPADFDSDSSADDAVRYLNAPGGRVFERLDEACAAAESALDLQAHRAAFDLVVAGWFQLEVLRLDSTVPSDVWSAWDGKLREIFGRVLRSAQRSMTTPANRHDEATE